MCLRDRWSGPYTRPRPLAGLSLTFPEKEGVDPLVDGGFALTCETRISGETSTGKEDPGVNRSEAKEKEGTDRGPSRGLVVTRSF